jgi:hypothetical protein
LTCRKSTGKIDEQSGQLAINHQKLIQNIYTHGLSQENIPRFQRRMYHLIDRKDGKPLLPEGRVCC